MQENLHEENEAFAEDVVQTFKTIQHTYQY